MKILGICGSHRKDSSTMFFLRKALEACGKEGPATEAVALEQYSIGACTACDYCKTKLACSLQDDMHKLYEKMMSADAIIIASPVYFAMVSGMVKQMFDRSLPLRRNGMRLRDKVGGAIAVGASRNGGQELVCQQIHSWMTLHEMIVVGDAGTAHFGGIGWVPRGTSPEDDISGAETCGNLGRRIADVLKRMKGAKEGGV